MLNAGERWGEWLETSVEVLKAVAPLRQFTCFSFQSLDLVNAGAYIYQELGYALAAGADILSKVSEKVALMQEKWRSEYALRWVLALITLWR